MGRKGKVAVSGFSGRTIGKMLAGGNASGKAPVESKTSKKKK